MSPLQWTCKITCKLFSELQEHVYEVSHMSVAWTLLELGYCLHALRKNQEGSEHPGRNAQFEYFNALVRKTQERLARHLSRH